MKIPESIKIEPNMAVVFKKRFDFNGVSCNAIVQDNKGSLIFFDTDKMHTDGTLKVAYRDIRGDLKESKK